MLKLSVPQNTGKKADKFSDQRELFRVKLEDNLFHNYSKLVKKKRVSAYAIMNLFPTKKCF